MTKLRDLRDGDRVRVTYTHEGTVRIANHGNDNSYVRLEDDDGMIGSSFGFDEDDYPDGPTVELLEKKARVGDQVSALADLPDGTVIRYISTPKACPLFKTPRGWASSATSDVMPSWQLGEGDVFRIEYLPA